MKEDDNYNYYLSNEFDGFNVCIGFIAEDVSNGRSLVLLPDIRFLSAELVDKSFIPMFAVCIVVVDLVNGVADPVFFGLIPINA